MLLIEKKEVEDINSKERMMPNFDNEVFTFPFGKHKDEIIEEIPGAYLEWVLENCNSIDQYLRDIIKAEIMRRVKKGIVIEEEQDWPDENGQEDYYD